MATKAPTPQMAVVSIGQMLDLALPVPQALKLVEILAKAYNTERRYGENGYSYADLGLVHVEMAFVKPQQLVARTAKKDEK